MLGWQAYWDTFHRSETIEHPLAELPSDTFLVLEQN